MHLSSLYIEIIYLFLKKDQKGRGLPSQGCYLELINHYRTKVARQAQHLLILTSKNITIMRILVRLEYRGTIFKQVHRHGNYTDYNHIKIHKPTVIYSHQFGKKTSPTSP